ncbi:MAG TPA: hypothetical protein VME86_14715 [Acidobacteriaceae bacterium]|nr:hypothetical protein [Acidobacteriaceae bacterium]
MLTERKVYGPPDYGETPSVDAHVSIFILRLAHAITVDPTANAETNGSANLDPVKDIREVQLFVSLPMTAEVRKLAGRGVVATGTLNESVTASQYTKVWLAATRLSPK